MKTIYVCESMVKYNSPNTEDHSCTFVSVDNKSWIDTNFDSHKEISIKDYDKIKELIYGKPNSGFLPCRMNLGFIYAISIDHKFFTIK